MIRRKMQARELDSVLSLGIDFEKQQNRKDGVGFELVQT